MRKWDQSWTEKWAGQQGCDNTLQPRFDTNQYTPDKIQYVSRYINLPKFFLYWTTRYSMISEYHDTHFQKDTIWLRLHDKNIAIHNVLSRPYWAVWPKNNIWYTVSHNISPQRWLRLSKKNIFLTIYCTLMWILGQYCPDDYLYLDKILIQWDYLTKVGEEQVEDILIYVDI